MKSLVFVLKVSQKSGLGYFCSMRMEIVNEQGTSPLALASLSSWVQVASVLDLQTRSSYF
jgi:hypothetical protein